MQTATDNVTVNKERGRPLTLVIDQFLQKQVVDKAAVSTGGRVGLHAGLETPQLPARANSL